MSDRFFFSILQAQARSCGAAELAAQVRALSQPIGFDVAILRELETGSPLILSVGGVKITVVPNTYPVEVEVLRPAIDLSIAWNEAAQAVALHTAHVVVGCLDLPQDHEEAIQFAVAATLVAASLLQLCGGSGAYWSTGELMLSADGLISASRRVLKRDLPVEDWVNLRWLRSGGTTHSFGAVSVGARSFIGREIELVPAALPPVEIAQRIFSTFRYLLARGAVLQDGDTLGQTGTDIFTVRLLETGAYHRGPVLQLTRQGGQQAQQPFSSGDARTTSDPVKAKRPVFGKRGGN